MIKYVAFAPGTREMRGNKALDRELMSRIACEFVFYADLTAAINAAGYQCMTNDVFLNTRPAEKALLISCAGSGYWFAAKEFIPALCFTFESPLTAWHFFHHLSWIAGKFHHLFMWPGGKDRIGNISTKFHDIFWPNLTRTVIPGPAWGTRSFLVMINSNKRAFQLNRNRISFSDPLKSLAWCGYYAYGQFVRRSDPWMFSELYIERLRAIHYFSSHRFDLFGQEWGNPVPGFERELRPCVEKCYRGSFPRGDGPKLAILSQYKFSLCFENTSFPGYITEKMFDCFFAGTIPVYLGAPDISDHVPAETFIDFRRFNSHDELNDFLNSMSEQEAQGYLIAAKEFMASSQFNKFQSNYLIEAMLAALNSVRDQHS